MIETKTARPPRAPYVQPPPTALVRHSKPMVPGKASEYARQNQGLLEDVLRVNARYRAQPLRVACKNCDGPISGSTFTSFGIDYVICPRCAHLNGAHEDTDAFLDELYTADGGANYGNDFTVDYEQRCWDVYQPKLEFLIETLRRRGAAPRSVFDVGCGGGHFLRACELRGISAAGVETSTSLIEMCKRQLSATHVDWRSIGDIYDAIAESTQEVTALLGVLEHLRHPRRAIEAFRRSGASYLYILVPMFGVSAFVEHATPNVFPRVLGAGHTHLYTEQSLRYLADEYDLEIVGEWWFGADVQDLYRVLLHGTGAASPAYTTALDAALRPCLEELQAVIDRHRQCSEVHMVFRRRG